MRQAYRCHKCKEVYGYLYDEQLEQPLPKCPKGHDTEFVLPISDGELAAVVKEANLEPSARESQRIESLNPDPLTYRQRLGKMKTDS